MSIGDTRPAVPAKAGDFVELRCGGKLGPIRPKRGFHPWVFEASLSDDKTIGWIENGRYDIDGGPHALDIVAIVPRPTPALQQPVERSGGLQMRVGGRYRLRNGEVWTCRTHHDGKYGIISDDLVTNLVCADGSVVEDPYSEFSVMAEVTDDATSELQQVATPNHPSRYHRQFCGVTLDLYRVANLWDVKSHALFHAMKKIMMAGNRGAKDYETDLREAIVAIQEELKIIEEGGA